MSEDSKMGLFGSKDDNTEATPEETVKQDSPDRHGPYCIDSESETYDTEALSITDINDIIGIQTEQAAESTLESEIAALSKIITDSRGENSSAAINTIPEENTEIKFTEDILTEFSTLSSVETHIPTTPINTLNESKEASVLEEKNIGKEDDSNFLVEAKAEDSSSENPAEVESDVGIDDRVEARAEAEMLGSIEEEIESNEAEAASISECKGEPLTATTVNRAEDSDDVEESDEISAAKKDSEADNVPVAGNSEMETIGGEIPDIKTQLLGENSEAIETGIDDEEIGNNQDILQSVISSESTTDDDVMKVKNPDPAMGEISENEEAIENVEDGKSVDILTNVGSTSKSLQLIGEAYISEDSQETDEKDSKVASPLSDKVQEQNTKDNQEPKQEIGSDEIPNETLKGNESKIVVATGDIPEISVVESSLDDRESTLLKEKEESEAMKEVPPEQEADSVENGQGLNTELEINGNLNEEKTIEDKESVDLRPYDDEKTNESSQLIEETSLQVESIVVDAISSPKTMLCDEIVVFKEEEPLPGKIEQLENIALNSECERNVIEAEGEVLTPDKNPDQEVLQEKISEETNLIEETIEISASSIQKSVTATENIVSVAKSSSAEDPELPEQSEIALVDESLCPESEDKRTKGADLAMQIEEEEVEVQLDESSEIISDIETKYTDFESGKIIQAKSIETLMEGKGAGIISEPSVLPAEMSTDLKENENRCTIDTVNAETTNSEEEQQGEISGNVAEEIPETVQEHVSDDSIVKREISSTVETEDCEGTELEVHRKNIIDEVIEGLDHKEENVGSETNELGGENVLEKKMTNESSIDSTDNVRANENDNVAEHSETETEKMENSAREMFHSENISRVDIDAIDCDSTSKNESKEKESLGEIVNIEKLSSDIVETGPTNSEILHPNLYESENETEKVDTVDLPVDELVKAQIEIPLDSELETLSGVTEKDIPASEIETVSENITSRKFEVESLEAIDSVTSETDLDKREEVTQKSPNSSEIDESKEVDSNTPIECGIRTSDRENPVRADTRDIARRLEENESIGDSSIDTENKLMEIIPKIDDTEIGKKECITEENSELIVSDSAISTESKIVLELTPIQNSARDSSLDTEFEKEKDEDTLQTETAQIEGEDSDGSEKQLEIDDSSETILHLLRTDIECSTGNTGLRMESEVRSAATIGLDEETSEISIQKSEDNADLEVILDKPECSVSCDKLLKNSSETNIVVHENLPEIISESLIKAEGSQGIEGETKTREDVPTFLESGEQLEKDNLSLGSGGELEENNLLSVNLVDENNSEVVADICPLDENLGSGEIPSADNEVENVPDEIISDLSLEIGPMVSESENLLESELKLDDNLKCEPIEDLDKLAVVADEILIDELASSVLKEGVQSLESLNDLEILPDGDLPTSAILNTEELKIPEITAEFSENKIEPASLLEGISDSCFIEDSNQAPSVSRGADYITNVILSSTNIENTQLVDNIVGMEDEIATAEGLLEGDSEDLLKTTGDLVPKISVSIDENIAEIDEVCRLQIDESLILSKNIEIDLPLKEEEEEEKLIESAVLGECDVKIDLPTDVLFDTDDAEQMDVLCSSSADNVDTSQQSSEISELECAVKFLQESEEQTIDSPLLLSPKIAEDIVEENSEQSKSCLFLPETEVLELEEITPNSIAISEAEIISEATKLESERKLKIAEELSKSSEGTVKLDVAKEAKLDSNSELLKSLLMTSEIPAWQRKSDDNAPLTPERSENSQIPKLSTSMRRSEKIPKTSILEERLKEPPKIEIPIPELSPRLMDTPTTPKTSLLIQRDSRTDTKTMYQKMLDSPKGERIEPKISDTPRKDMDRHDFENVGSPRIILKIAKSAIADCSEPRSPKSPKIRSAANSPNPEDSPGQKLGKIKLKLSRGGHPSIIPNDHFDESAQRYTEAILSPSHIGMKIKLSRTGDASIIQPDRHDPSDEIKESKHKFDEVSPKRIESPLGMKIKLSKTGDPSIVQQDATPKRKDKLDIGQEIPKRTDSPIGMKIKLSKSGDASIIQPDRQETSEDTAHKEKYDIQNEIPKRTDSPIGVKIKLSKSGDTSILSSESCEEFKDASSKSRDKLGANQDIPKRTDSPLGMKFKLTKSGGASIIQPEKPEALEEFKEKPENVADITKRVESPIGMKIKLLKTGDASIIHPEKQEQDEHKESVATKHREKSSEMQDIQKRTDSPIGMRIKVMRSGEASVFPFEVPQECQEPSSPNNENFKTAYEIPKRNESPIGMKIKLSKSGDASIIHPERQEFSDESKDSAGSSRGSLPSSQEGSKASESPLGMKIKLSKTGDASIIHPGISSECKDSQSKRIEKLQEGPKRTESPLGMKIKLSKTGDASIIEPEKKEKLTSKQKEKLSSVQEVSHKRKETEFPIEMKIKLSKTGHPTIIANEKQESVTETYSKSKEYPDGGQSTYQKRAEPTSPVKDPQLRIFKTGHSTIIQSSRSEVTIEPIQMSNQQKPESSVDIPSKCNDVTISPVDVKKSKLEAKLSQILPEVTIQPVSQMSGEPKQIMIDKKSGSISRQQMSVINQEISITQVPPTKPADLSMSGKLKEILRKNATNSPANSDCEIIEHRPELIIVNENSNSSQDIMIIEEVKVPVQEVKIPRKRGRPKRSSLPTGPTVMRQLLPMPKDPLALEIMQQPNAAEHRESDRPKRTCRNQKSYAPPKRGRGRGRGKRKMDRADCAIGKIPRLEDPLTEIERSTLRLIAPLQPRIAPVETAQTSELYKALKQTPAERKRLISETLTKQGFPEAHKKLRLEVEPDKQLAPIQAGEIKTVEQAIAESSVSLTADSSVSLTADSKTAIISGMLQLTGPVSDDLSTNKLIGEPKIDIQEEKNIISEMATTEHQNWLTPSIKLPEAIGKTEAISMVQVMDEETRMSAESNSRSQTPARNISVPAVETVINEESQGSVLSTATTESEKVKVKNRRMEINFDPDEGPFTVDKIAEYEWPLDKKGDTFMIQEQISQYLGVKSFKRKYPDLKRRMVEMEERNFLRENGLVGEAMCDMGLTAICSTEVLDVMCSDFPDQYEEYRKHMREKQAKEHSKKQKELTAAANAERNRIDLAEMAVQSALSWNVNFNKARKESRKYSLDLQSFTIHVPKKQLKVDVEKKPSNYPVALIPGQYTDYYREYTPAELRYYPLNTVLYGPMRPNERKFDSQSEGSQSDSDSDSSSDDSSSSSSEGTQDTEESQSTVDEVEIEAAANNKEENKNLKCKMCLKHLNKHGKAEVLIQCGTCNGNVHPSCIDLTLDMVPHIQGYSWQCTDCKTCVQCHNPADEDKMLFCDMCDRGYHIYCVGLRRVPQGRWHCRECAVCASCGLRQPGGANSDRNSVAQWQHEYKKGERNTRVYVSTLCVPCSKLWRKGRYCPHCSRCHSAQRLDLEPNLVHCGACDKYLHLGCVEIRYGTIDRKNYICECCSTPNQQHSSRPLMSKSFKT